MNIIITWAHDQLIFSLSDVIWFLISFMLCLIFLGCIVGAFASIVARYSNKIMLKHDIILVTIGDNGEKLLLTNASDIEWVKSYMVDMPNADIVKYVYNHYTDETFKIIGGMDFISIDLYDEDT